jgi:hypothetical protein
MMSDSTKLIIACSMFATGQCLAWFQLNSQFVWEWWSNKPVLTVLIYSIPTGLCFLLGIRLSYEVMNEVWGPRFLIFGMSYLTFPLLTWHFLNETMFTTKTMICVMLSFSIVLIQLLWKN